MLSELQNFFLQVSRLLLLQHGLDAVSLVRGTA